MTTNCPYCDEDPIQLTYESLETEDGINAYQCVKCPTCKKVWYDVYQRTHRIDENGETIEEKV